MKIRLSPLRVWADLIALDLLVVVLIIAVTFFSSNVLRIILGVPFLLFSPGYMFISCLFPRRDWLDAVDRLALSFGTSIAIVPVIALILNYTSWGIRLEPVLYSVSGFVLIVSVITWLRRRSLTEQERFRIVFRLKLPGLGNGVRERTLSIALIAAILGTVGVSGYVIAFPNPGEKFTEFYILDAARQMANYPQTMVLGTPGNVVLNIVNHEHQETTYRIEIRESGGLIQQVGPVTVQDEQKWEQKTAFTPVSAGDNQTVEFLLFKGGGTDPYLSLHLRINVR